MGSLHTRISKSPNYIKRFGVLNGFRLLFQIERDLPKTSPIVKKYRLTDYPAPIHLRETVSDHAIFWQCLVNCQYDIRDFPQYKRLTAAYRTAVDKGIGPLIIDCGGNIGLATVWLATLFPEAVVYVVEPDDANFEILRMNTACFGDRVVPLKGGVWHESGELRIVNPDSGSAAFRVAAGAGSRDSIRAYTIDEICGLAGAEFPMIVKIDIEGAQANLFKGNTSWVRKTHLITLELDDWLLPWQGTSRQFFSCMSQYAFDYLISGESIFCFRDFEAIQ